MTVTALMVGRSPASPLAAPSDLVHETLPLRSLADLREAADRATSELLWILDARCQPAPDALPALLDAGRRPAVSVPTDFRGQIAEPLLGRFDDSDDEAVLAAVEERRVPLRHTPVVSLLVDRSAVLALAPPDPGRFADYAGTEWTVRLFRPRAGVLVPTSRVMLAAASDPAFIPALRMLRSGAWRRGETLRELRRSLRR